MTYATNTTVSVEKSEAEIKRNLLRHGADQIGVMQGDEGAMVMFRMNGRTYRFALRLPMRDDKEYTHYVHGRSRRPVARSEEAAERFWEQACRSHWRALNLVIKAKLEAVDAGIVTFEDEFMPHAMVNPKQTLGEIMKPQLEAYYAEGKPPAGLPMLTGPSK